ncbi:MAG TPA: tripartite tricarboxylate transporter substrate binding protein [Xanthobacteraceae bacterium]|jgi:tripartite-type tricarboxylate transporter receptor subunit TctC|nr:tripartite tricarboxylate transporter substrate binding protein [Xanthobacteraceae bacterium]
MIGRGLVAMTVMAFAFGMAGVFDAGAQISPDRPIKVIVPYAPGGPSDVTLRTLQQRIQAAGGPTIVVENRTGGGGVIAAQAVKQATPDGTTLFLTDLPTFGINPHVMSDFPIDPVRDFKPLSALFAFPSLLVVPFGLPANSVAELVELAKKTPGGMSYGSQGQGSGGQLLAEMFGKAAGLKFIHVPYRGSALAYPDLIAGRVSFIFGSYGGARPFLLDNRLRALAVPSKQRLVALPDVPTMEELGYRDMELDIWNGLVAPAGTPDEIVAQLRELFVKQMVMPDMVAKLAEQGIYVRTNTPEEFAAQIKSDLARLEPIVRAAGAKIN